MRRGDALRSPALTSPGRHELIEGVQVGIDPGSKHTGLAVFTDHDGSRAGRYAIRLDHRGALIRDRLTSRAAYRRGRRSRNLLYRSPRFLNGQHGHRREDP